jgi:molybdate transport system substrate-binding protein
MDSLEARGFLVPGTRADILENTLVLIAPADGPALQGFKDLGTSTVNVIALGEPSTVPAGEYATQTLTHLDLLEPLQKKIVYAKDVRAVLTYVETGNADAGFVYQTDAQTSSEVRVVAVAPPDSHDPIVYPGAVLKNSSHPEAARDFLAYLEARGAQQVFEKYGFVQPKSRPRKN